MGVFYGETWPAEQKMEIMLTGMGANISVVCRKLDITDVKEPFFKVN